MPDFKMMNFYDGDGRPTLSSLVLNMEQIHLGHGLMKLWVRCQQFCHGLVRLTVQNGRPCWLRLVHNDFDLGCMITFPGGSPKKSK